MTRIGRNEPLGLKCFIQHSHTEACSKRAAAYGEKVRIREVDVYVIAESVFISLYKQSGAAAQSEKVKRCVDVEKHGRGRPGKPYPLLACQRSSSDHAAHARVTWIICLGIKHIM